MFFQLKKFHVTKTFVLQVMRRNYGVKYFQKNNASNSLVKISDFSTITIGGHDIQGVPNLLIEALNEIPSKNLTVITNASIFDNKSLLELLKSNGKISNFVTSLSKNKEFISSFSLPRKINFNLISNSDFIINSFHGSVNIKENNVKIDFSLVKAPFVDLGHNLIWPKGINSYYNDIFAKASLESIVEVSNVKEFNDNVAQISVPGIYVKNIVINENEVVESTSERSSFKLEYGDDVQKVSKAFSFLLNLVQNGDNIYFSNSKIANIVKQFFMPKHLNIHVLNDYIDNHWPHHTEWLSCARKLNILVLDAKSINKFGELSLNGSEDERTKVIDLIKASKAKLIAIEALDKIVYSDHPIDLKVPFTVKRLVTADGIINLKTESDKIKRYSSL